MNPSMKIGIVGQGKMGRIHAAAWRELNAGLVFFDVVDSAEIARTYDGQSADSLDDLMDAVDAVDLCVPTSEHYHLAIEALKRGLPVLCEKPLARTMEEAVEMAQVAARNKVLLMPAHVTRFFAQYQVAKAQIDDGLLGQVAVMRFHREGPAPASPWFQDDSVSGGVILDQMIHDIDAAIWFAGRVRSVHATENRMISDTGIRRAAHVTMTHTCGAITHCRGYWGGANTPFAYGFDLAGLNARISYESDRETGYKPYVQPSDNPMGYFDNPYVAELSAFADEVAGKGHRAVSAADGLEAIAVALAALRSAAEGKPVLIDYQELGESLP